MGSQKPISRSERQGKERLAILPTTEAMREAFAAFLELDVAAGNAAPDTVITYLRRVNQYLNWCSEQKVNPALATESELKSYRHYLIGEKKLKSSTIAITLVAVRRFYTSAVAQKLVKENPVRGLKPPKEKVDAAERITFLEEEELRDLLSMIPRDGSLASRRDLALLAIMALQGPRTKELHQANFGDLIRSGKNWGLRVEGKGNIRTIPLRPDLAEVLWQYLEAREAQGEILVKKSPLFISLSHQTCSQRLSRRGIRWIVDKYLEAANLKHAGSRTLSAHSFRHTAGTLGLKGEGDLRQVQDLLGHSDLKTTAIYLHVRERYTHNPALNIDVEI